MAGEPKKKIPSTPKHLSKEAAQFWRRVCTDYDLRPDELRILQDACREMDIVDRLELELADAPLMVSGSMGQLVASPLVSEVRQHRTVLSALLRALKLPDEGEESGTGASAAGAALANRRWNRGAA